MQYSRLLGVQGVVCSGAHWTALSQVSDMHGGDVLAHSMGEMTMCSPPEAVPLAQPESDLVVPIQVPDQLVPSGDDLSMSDGGDVTATALEVSSLFVHMRGCPGRTYLSGRCHFPMHFPCMSEPQQMGHSRSSRVVPAASVSRAVS
jgi:hypothetical protein